MILPVTRTAAVALASIVATCGVLTACTSHGTTPRPTASASPSGTTGPQSATPSITQHPVPPPTAIANDTARRKYVTMTGCAASSGGWAASGTATNPGAHATSYTITIFFTTSTATVLDFAKTTVAVPAGQHRSWRAAARFSAPANMLCVLRGVS